MKNKASLLQYCLIVLIILQIISGFFPENLFWGLDYWRYIPYGFPLILCFIISYILLVWIGRKWLRGLIDKIIDFVLTKPRIWISFLCALVGAGIFYLFRVKLFFLGDGYIVIRSVTEGSLYVVREPLDVITHSIIYKSLSSILSVDAAIVLEALGRYSEAIQNLTNALKLKPNYPEASTYLNQLYQKK